MEDFENVKRYTFYSEYGYGTEEVEDNGDSVDYLDYKALLDAYLELKFIIEGLEK